MPTVPGDLKAAMALAYGQENPTPEQLLITAADMHQHGQLTDNPTMLTDPRASTKLPSIGGRRGRSPQRKRR